MVLPYFGLPGLDIGHEWWNVILAAVVITFSAISFGMLIGSYFNTYHQAMMFGSITIILLSGLTDLADGYIARRFHRISNLGKILDPVADKLTQAAMLICLFTRFPHVLLLIVIMAGKELYMVVSGCLVIRKTGKVHGADWHGKIVTFLLYGTAAVHIIWFHITPMVSDLLIGLCAIMMVISVALYIIQNTRTIKGETI